MDLAEIWLTGDNKRRDVGSYQICQGRDSQNPPGNMYYQLFSTGGGQVSDKSVTESCKQETNRQDGAELLKAEDVMMDVCANCWRICAKNLRETGKISTFLMILVQFDKIL